MYTLNEVGSSKEKLRELFLNAIKKKGHGQFLTICENIAKLADTQQLVVKSRDFDSSRCTLEQKNIETLREIIWDLICERILILGESERENEASWPFLKLTAYGKEVVNSVKPSPHDPSGYISELKRIIPKIDEVIITYLNESLTAYRHGVYLASYVTLGCASEKGILLLIYSYLNTIEDPEKRAVKEKKIINNISIKNNFDNFWKIIYPNLPKIIGNRNKDDFEIFLRPIFEILRNYRNDAGHPINVSNIDPKRLKNTFDIFINYLEILYTLIDFYNPSP